MIVTHNLPSEIVIHDMKCRADLPAAVQVHINELWRQEQHKRGDALFDGQIFSLTDWTEDGLFRGHFVPYSWYVAQRRDPSLFVTLKTRPLAVAGVTITGDEHLVVAQRSSDVTQAPGGWELAPAGGLDASCLQSDGTLCYAQQITVELKEELGCNACDIASLTPFALIINDASHVHDIGIKIRLSISASNLALRFERRTRTEYKAMIATPLATAEEMLRPLHLIQDSLHLLSAAAITA